MAKNYYTTVTADRGLKATRDEYKALEAALGAADEDDEVFEVEYYDEQVRVFASEWLDWQAVPQHFLDLLGSLIVKNGLDYLEFGPAFLSDKPTMGICDPADAYFRIRSNGSVWEPTLSW